MNKVICIVIGVIFFASCASYKQSLMFTDRELYKLQSDAQQLSSTYTLANFDRITLKVFTKNGERIIDPDNVLLIQGNNQSAGTGLNFKNEEFLINKEGLARFPMIGEVKLTGLTLREAELTLQKVFADYYENVFVTLHCTTRRVVLLGTGGGQVLPLPNENVLLTEVLALSKVFAIDSKAKNIAILRGNDVLVADFTTIDGFRKTNYEILPGDIVYVEPVRRPLLEATRDYSQFFSLALSMAVLVLTLTR